MKQAKDYSLKEILLIINRLEINKDMLPGYAITTARYCRQFRKAGSKDYEIIYNELFNRFKQLSKTRRSGERL